MRAVAHWDDVPTETEDLGVIGGTWSELAPAVGCRRLGVHRIQVPAGKAATPQHAEDEEIFYVLHGSGWSVQSDGTFAVEAGDVVYYRAFEVAHTVVAGPGGIDMIALGTSDGPRGVTAFPRIDRLRIFDHLLSGSHEHQWELEARLDPIAIPDEPDPRPETIVARDHVPVVRFGAVEGRLAGRHLGTHGIALNFAFLPPGEEGAPPHCHSMEEELFVVLEGDGVLTLGDEEHPVRTGSIVGRPPGTGVAHAFRGGERGMTLLMFGDKHGGDMTYYPRTGEVRLRGLGVSFTVS